MYDGSGGYLLGPLCNMVGSYLLELLVLVSPSFVKVWDGGTDWHNLPLPNVTRSNQSVFLNKHGQLCVIGWSPYGLVDPVECFDAHRHEWILQKEIVKPSAVPHAYVMARGVLYSVNRSSIFKIVDNHPILLSDNPEGNNHLDCVPLYDANRNRIWIATDNAVVYYDVERNQWHTTGPPRQIKPSGTMALIGDRLYYTFYGSSNWINMLNIQEETWTVMDLDDQEIEIAAGLQVAVTNEIKQISEPVPMTGVCPFLDKFKAMDRIDRLPRWEQYSNPRLAVDNGKLLVIGWKPIVRMGPRTTYFPYEIFKDTLVVSSWDPVTLRRTLVSITPLQPSPFTTLLL